MDFRDGTIKFRADLDFFKTVEGADSFDGSIEGASSYWFSGNDDRLTGRVLVV